MTEEKKEPEVPKEFYVSEVPASYQKVLMFGENVVNADVLIAIMANSIVKAGIMKLEDFEGK